MFDACELGEQFVAMAVGPATLLSTIVGDDCVYFAPAYSKVGSARFVERMDNGDRHLGGIDLTPGATRLTVVWWSYKIGQGVKVFSTG